MISQVLEKRLRDRGTENEEALSTRLHNAREEIEYGNAEVRCEDTLLCPPRPNI